MARQVLLGCVVAPSASVALGVDVSAGLIEYDGAYILVPAVNGLPLANADPQLDRYDAIVVDNTPTISALQGVAGQSVAPSDATKIHLGAAPVLAAMEVLASVQDARVLPGSIPVLDLTTLTPPSAPGLTHVTGVSQSFAYSFLNNALAAADPGTGNCGFDTTNAINVAHLYINYTNPAGAALLGRIGVGVFAGMETWLAGGQGGTPIIPYYLLMFSRKDPTAWILVKVTAVTDHGTWADVSVTFVTMSQNALLTAPLSTDALDTILQWAGVVPPAAPTTWTTVKKTANTSRSNNAALAADPDLQFAMAANTNYIIRGTIRFDSTSATPGFKCDFDGPAAPTRVMVAVWDAAQAGTPAFIALDSTLDVAKTLNTAAGGTPGIVHFEIIIENGANAGTFSFRWCQSVSNAAGVNVRLGSYLEYLVS